MCGGTFLSIGTDTALSHTHASSLRSVGRLKRRRELDVNTLPVCVRYALAKVWELDTVSTPGELRKSSKKCN